MRTLYIHRHAKAVKHGYENDFSRDLLPKGMDDGHHMGRYLKRMDFLADLVITSPANRALQTAELVTQHTGERLVRDERLYQSQWNTLMDILREQAPSLQAIRLVGHNPELEELAAALCGIRPGGIHLATCGILCIQCDIDGWDELKENSGALEWYIRPMNL